MLSRHVLRSNYPLRTFRMTVAPGLYFTLGAARTLSGREIYRRRTDRQNHLRSRLAELSWQVVSSLERHGLSEPLLLDTVSKLRHAQHEPRHFGDNTPASHFEGPSSIPVVPDSRFSYWNLLEYGLSGEQGFEGFIALCAIVPSIDRPTLFGLIALLLIDSAVEHLDRKDPFIAGSDAVEAAFCVEQMFHDRGYRHILEQARKDLARKGGIAAHRETDEYKAEVIAKWRTGVFTTKAEAARWAMKQFPLRSQEVIVRWLRAAERNTDTTELDG